MTILPNNFMIIRSVVFMYHQSCRNNTIFITTMVDVSSPLRTKISRSTAGRTRRQKHGFLQYKSKKMASKKAIDRNETCAKMHARHVIVETERTGPGINVITVFFFPNKSTNNIFLAFPPSKTNREPRDSSHRSSDS